MQIFRNLSIFFLEGFKKATNSASVAALRKVRLVESFFSAKAWNQYQKRLMWSIIKLMALPVQILLYLLLHCRVHQLKLRAHHWTMNYPKHLKTWPLKTASCRMFGHLCWIQILRHQKMHAKPWCLAASFTLFNQRKRFAWFHCLIF